MNSGVFLVAFGVRNHPLRHILQSEVLLLAPMDETF